MYLCTSNWNPFVGIFLENTIVNVNDNNMEKVELMEQLKSLLGNDVTEIKEQVEEIKSQLYRIYRQEQETARKQAEEAGEAFTAAADEVETEFRQLLQVYKTQRAEAAAKREEEMKQNQLRKERIIDMMKQLAESEAADAELTELVEAAGLVHDCGIKPGEAKYGAGHCTGKIQEQEGPAVARELLQKVGYAPEKIERICYLVGHHHTYNMIDGLDYQLLVEADFIVNFYEDGTPKENIAKAVERVFKTESGTKLVKTMFGL